MRIKNRIKELRNVRASELVPNPRNWRTHPVDQKNALRGVLAEIGWAEAVVVRETPEGTFELIDGHMRAETAGDAEIPCLILDVTAEEADKLLATLDPIASMAEANAAILDGLLANVKTESDALQSLLNSLKGQIPKFTAPLPTQSDIDRITTEMEDRFKATGPAEMVKVVCPDCGSEFEMLRREVLGEKPWQTT